MLVNSKTIIVLLLVFNSLYYASSQAYNIKIEVKGAANKDAQLTYYLGDSRYIHQTGKFNNHDQVVFAGENKLKTGIYQVIVGNTGYFDILIRNEQNFSISTDTIDVIKHAKIKNSKENSLFFDYQKKMVEFQNEIAKIEALIKKTSNNSDSVEILKKKKETAQSDLEKFANKTKDENPESYLAKLISAMVMQDIDKFDFSDEELLRTPFYPNLIRSFIKKNIEKSPSVIIYETEKLLNTIKNSRENYEFIAGYLLNFYNTFYKYGMNEVFVSLADTYFLPDKAKWLNSTDLEQVKQRRDFFNQSLPGNKAQDLVLKSVSGEYISLLQVNSKYTLLFFWSVGCGHCATATKTLKDNYDKLKEKGIEIYAVNIDKNEADWKKKVEENELTWVNCIDADEVSNYRDKYYVYGSPLLYVIDSDKKIISVRNGELEIEKMVLQLLSF